MFSASRLSLAAQALWQDGLEMDIVERIKMTWVYTSYAHK